MRNWILTSLGVGLMSAPAMACCGAAALFILPIVLIIYMAVLGLVAWAGGRAGWWVIRRALPEYQSAGWLLNVSRASAVVGYLVALFGGAMERMLEQWSFLGVFYAFLAATLVLSLLFGALPPVLLALAIKRRG